MNINQPTNTNITIESPFDYFLPLQDDFDIRGALVFPKASQQPDVDASASGNDSLDVPQLPPIDEELKQPDLEPSSTPADYNSFPWWLSEFLLPNAKLAEDDRSLVFPTISTETFGTIWEAMTHEQRVVFDEAAKEFGRLKKQERTLLSPLPVSFMDLPVAVPSSELPPTLQSYEVVTQPLPPLSPSLDFVTMLNHVPSPSNPTMPLTPPISAALNVDASPTNHLDLSQLDAGPTCASSFNFQDDILQPQLPLQPPFEMDAFSMSPFNMGPDPVYTSPQTFYQQTSPTNWAHSPPLESNGFLTNERFGYGAPQTASIAAPPPPFILQDRPQLYPNSSPGRGVHLGMLEVASGHGIASTSATPSLYSSQLPATSSSNRKRIKKPRAPRRARKSTLTESSSSSPSPPAVLETDCQWTHSHPITDAPVVCNQHHTKRTLPKHIRKHHLSHLGKKIPVKTEVMCLWEGCGSTLQLAQLTRHLWEHLGWLEQVCPLCGEDFVRSDSLKRHIVDRVCVDS